MIKIEYIITDGRNYISRVKTGITVVGNIVKARRFSTYDKAKNVLKSLPRTLKQFDFKIEECTEIIVYKIEDREKFFQRMQEEDNKYSSLMDNLSNSLTEFEGLIINLKQYNKYINVQFEVIKRALRDIMHKLEFENLDMYKSWLITKDAQKILQRRRKLKNDQDIIKFIMKQKIGDLSNNAISEYIRNKEMSEPTYMARYLDYLFV